MKKRIKIIIGLGVAMVVGLGAYIYACAFDPEWRDYGSVFSPEVTVDNYLYKPLFFDSSNYFYDNDYIDRNEANYVASDTGDWEQYLGDALPSGVPFYLFDEQALPEIRKFNAATNKAKLRLLYHTPHRIDNRVLNFFQFLEIARGNEYITNAGYNPWDYEQGKAEKTSSKEIAKAEKLYQSAKDTDLFFANRMWYQVMRLKFYSGNKSAVISFFEQTEAQQPKNTLYYRALHYMAGAYISQKNYAKANAYLAQVYNGMPKLMQMLTYEYHPLTDKEVSQIATTLLPEEQCALWAMQGYYNNEVVAIQKILAIDSKSPHIDFLLSRYVNKVESKVNIWGAYNEKDITSVKKYHQYTKQITTKDLATDWLLQGAESEKVHNPYLWYLSAGYIAMFRNEFDRAREFLRKAEREAKNKDQQVQLRLIEALNEVSSCEKIDKETEERLFKKMEWLWKAARQNSNENTLYNNTLRYNYVFSFVRNYLSTLYKDAHNTLMAEITQPQRGFYKDKNQSVAIEKFLLKKNKTPWEDLWAKEYAYTLGDIYESRAIYAFYEDNIDGAIAEMEKAPVQDIQEYDVQKDTTIIKRGKRGEVLLPANPFNGFIKDCHDCEHEKKQLNPYSKLSFLKKVKEMEGKIAKGNDVYNNALLVGNAFYNASYFGNIRKFYYNSIVGEEGGYRIEKENQKLLLSMEIAKKYYTLAQQHASTDEQRAKIAYMLAKVERNEFYNERYFFKDDWSGVHLEERVNFKDDWNGVRLEERVDFKDWQGFKELRKYPHTQYYKEVIRECGYFRQVSNKR